MPRLNTLTVKKPSPPNSQTARSMSRVHVVPLFLLFFSFPSWWGRNRRRRLLLLHEIFPVERARGVQLQPWRDAFQVEQVVLVAGQTDDEGVFVCFGLIGLVR